MVTPERLEQLKKILGVTDPAKDDLLTFLPEQLERPLVMIAAAHWKSAGYGKEQVAAGPVTSVKRGDVTTSFAAAAGADASSGTFELGGGDGFFGWRTTLNAYRKLRW